MGMGQPRRAMGAALARARVGHRLGLHCCAGEDPRPAACGRSRRHRKAACAASLCDAPHTLRFAQQGLTLSALALTVFQACVALYLFLVGKGLVRSFRGAKTIARLVEVFYFKLFG